MPRHKPRPIHPLAMADALREINDQASAVVMSAHTARDLMADANADQLRIILAQVCTQIEKLREAMWPDEEGG